MDPQRGMQVDHNFPTKLFTVDGVPEPFRGTLKDNLSPNEQLLLIYSPAFSTLQDLPAESAPVNVDSELNGASPSFRCHGGGWPRSNKIPRQKIGAGKGKVRSDRTTKSVSFGPSYELSYEQRC